jgi:hypothetical protein
VASAQAEGAADSTPAKHGSVFADPLGFVLFGPRIGVELGTDQDSVAIYGRWMNEGVLSHSLFLDNGDRFNFSYGVGFRARYYFENGLRSFHIGPAFELIRTSIETPSQLVVTKSMYGVPHLEAGYRYPFGRFYADGSAMLGYAIKVMGKVENLPGGNNASLYRSSNENKFYGSASLEFGVYF